MNVQNFDNLQGCIFGLTSNVNVNVNVQKTVQKRPGMRLTMLVCLVNHQNIQSSSK